MRFIKKLSWEEEGRRLVERDPVRLPGMISFKVDPVEVEPIGTIILTPLMVVGWDEDCDGSLMARLEPLNLDEETLLDEKPAPKYATCSLHEARMFSLLTHWGLTPSTGFVVTAQELVDMIRELKQAGSTPAEKTQ